MDFGFTEEQEILRKAARDFLENECPKSMVREMAEDTKGYSLELWKKMAGLGWPGLAIPSRYGGSDGSFMDLAVLLEETGRALLPAPYYATVVLGSLFILDTGNEQQKEEFLPAITNGKLLVTLALSEPDVENDAASIAVTATPEDGKYTINGTKLFVPYANVADHILCVARTAEGDSTDDGLSVFIVNAQTPGITCTPLKTLARDNQCEVVFEDVPVSGDSILGELNNGWKDVRRALQRATVALCVDMNGGAQKVLEMTIDYARQRIQFGRPIGSMQALQHHCANISVSIEASRSLAYEAAWRISEGLPCTAEVSMAKAFASECYTQTTQLGMMIHGGVGFMEDHDLSLYYRRAKATEIMLGDADYHRELIASEILD